MVEVHIREDGRSRPSSFFATGHAGWAASGADVVCAAVSTVLQTAWLGLAEVVAIDVDAERGDATLRLAWPVRAGDDPAVRAIVDTATVAIEHLAAQFPEHVRAIREPDEG